MHDDRPESRPHRTWRVDGGAGGGLLDPIVVASLALLLLNDHVLKGLARGTSWAVLTGKLSDIAGLVFLPVLIVAGLEQWRAFRGRYRQPSPRQATVVAVAIAAVFVAMKTSAHVGAAYAWTLAALQWPVRALLAVSASLPLPALRPVAHVVDPTDVIGVVGVAWVVWQTRRRAEAVTRG
jgi:hypothetical protein